MNITHIRKEASESEKAIDCYNGNDYLGMTTRSRDDFTLSIRLTKNGKTIKKDIPLSKVLALPDTIYSDSIADSTITKKIYATAYRSCFNSDDIICDWQINRNAKNRDIRMEDHRISMREYEWRHSRHPVRSTGATEAVRQKTTCTPCSHRAARRR